MSRRTVPSWRVADAPAFRLQRVLLPAAVLAILLIEVWQTSTVASLSMQLGRSAEARRQARAELAWAGSRLERSSDRSQLGPVAGALGLRPVDPHRIVTLPEEYLEPASGRPASSPTAPLLAFAGRALGALVPDAAARGRDVN